MVWNYLSFQSTHDEPRVIWSEKIMPSSIGNAPSATNWQIQLSSQNNGTLQPRHEIGPVRPVEAHPQLLALRVPTLHRVLTLMGLGACCGLDGSRQRDRRNSETRDLLESNQSSPRSSNDSGGLTATSHIHIVPYAISDGVAPTNQSRRNLPIEILWHIASYGVAREMMGVNSTWTAVASSKLHWSFRKPEDLESLLSSREGKSLLSPVKSMKVLNPINDSHIKFFPASLRLLNCTLFDNSAVVSLQKLSDSCPGLSELTIEIKSLSPSEGKSNAQSNLVLTLYDLAPLASLQGLTKLSLSGIDVASSDFSGLAARPNLQSLRVEGPGGVFEAKSTGAGRPKEFKLDWRNPNDSDMVSLARRTSSHLTTLRVNGSGGSPDDPRFSLHANGLAALGEVRTLRELSLSHVDLSGDDGQQTIEKLLTRCPLESFQVKYSPLPPGAIDYVLQRGHETLRQLEFWGSPTPCQHTPDAVHIGQFPQLEHLHFSQGAWTQGLRGLEPSHLPRLESIYFTDCPIKVVDLQALASLPSLKSVSMDGGELADEVCRILANAPAMESLTLYECNVSADALHAMAQNQNIHDLDLNQTTLDLRTAIALGTLPRCESLWFGELQLASGEDASAVLTALAQSKSMKDLDLHFDSSQEIPASACAALARMSSLRDLKLCGTLTPEAVEELAKVRWLDSLEIADCTFIGDCSAALDKLCAHRGIHDLDLWSE
jgi:hypothetical protein